MMMKKFFSVLLLGLICCASIQARFGGGAIDKELFDFIRTILPEKSTILELGSGWGTEELAKFYTMYSIEHDSDWVYKYDSTYIYAPIEGNWYDVEIVQAELPKEYDLILVDGPPGWLTGRAGFFQHLDLFNTDVMIIIDDTNRPAEYNLLVLVANKLGRAFSLFKSADKSFGVIYPKGFVVEKE